ncbi:isthmin-2 isoform X2 [Astyanax mexicanus]|uniref:Isthmin-2 n=2 Tax=Astyanax mexicanus TaxID=7994 RepID=A0A8B9GXT5_ASTMX|nr:isthmin-2 isoform X2 [Astyanax mexicanus]
MPAASRRVCVPLVVFFFTVCVDLVVVCFPTRQQKSTVPRIRHSAAAPEENQVQSVLVGSQQRWRSQHHSLGFLPQPESKEESYILDLKKFPDLARADIGSQNPNIQVTIEVVNTPPVEVEVDLVREHNSDWPISSSSPSSVNDWLSGKMLFWPLFWGYTDVDSGEDGMRQAVTGINEEKEEEEKEEEKEEDYTSDYDSGEPLPSGLGGIDGEWDSQRNLGWDSTHTYYEKKEWSRWTSCSVTCGHGNQTRSRTCGDFCISTESRSCDLDPCPDNLNPISNVFPFEMENGTEPFGTDIDSCDKWLNCKSKFLQRYLQQVLMELPSCPCIYPSEVFQGMVTLQDKGHNQTFHWKDASDLKEHLDIYKPSASSCLRSALSAEGTTLAAQHCCYDSQGQLITRGKGAGTPNLISTEFSPELHFKVDVLPWILCKGDWSRFHAVRPPNNDLHCPENPHQDIFLNELEEAKEY